MAWNPSPEVQVARDAASRLGTLAGSQAIQTVVVYMTADGRLGVVTYGANKALCGEAKKLGDSLHKATLDYYQET